MATTEDLSSRMLKFEEMLDKVTQNMPCENVPPNSNQAAFSSFLAFIRDEFQIFKKKVELDLLQIKQDVGKCNSRMNDMEQYSRRNCLLIHGLKEQEQDGDCLNAVLDVFCNKMKLDIRPEFIDRTHRLGPRKEGGKVRAVIVKFISYYYRRMVFSNKKLLKNSGCYMTEALTKFNVQILSVAKREFGQENVWSMDGRIILKIENRKHILTSIQSIHAIRSQMSGSKAKDSPKPTPPLHSTPTHPTDISTFSNVASTASSPTFHTPNNQHNSEHHSTSSSYKKKKKSRHARRWNS